MARAPRTQPALWFSPSCSSLWRSRPLPSLGMAWNPMGRFLPWAKRTI